MKKAVWSGIIAALGVLTLSTPAVAQPTAGATVTVTATVNAKAKLTINGASTASISFADADPDVSGTVAATPLTIDVRARTSGSSSVTLTVRASQDLTSSAPSTIAISALKWSSTGTDFTTTGTSSTTGDISVLSFTGSGTRVGTQTYALDNSWAYATGTYGTTLTYTLTAP
jgi:hypothetical protein